MAVVCAFYRGGLATLTPDGWSGMTLGVLLVGADTWTFDVTDTSLVDMSISTAELSAANYNREPLTPGTPAFASGRWTLPVAATVWTSLGTDEPVYAAIGCLPAMTDAESVPLWALYDDTGAAIGTLDGSDCTVTFDLGVV